MPKRYDHGDCYQVAYGLVFQIHGSLLAHGEVTGTKGPHSGKRFGHAWIEIGDFVLDCANGNNSIVPHELYYAIGKCRGITRYTVEEAAKSARTHGHYGPWETNNKGVANDDTKSQSITRRRPR